VPPIEGDWFVDAAEESGLDFVHFNGMTGRFDYPEIIGSGAALFDFDNDGDLDVFLVQERMLRPGVKPLAPPPGPLPLQGRLFRNELGAAPALGFTDVTEASGLAAREYGMGAATGDVNNDGCVDLYLTNLGANQLYRNNCNGTFSDVSKASGTADASWSVSAAFFDFDRDGWLDLFVGNYLGYSVAASARCYGPSGLPDYCSPDVYRPQPSRLYRNNRDGTFADVTARAGMLREFGPALGVVAADVDADGWIDLYVANDGQENQLWMNQHDGTFRNRALLSGVAVSSHGTPKAGMGVDAGDIDNDGDEDLFVTNLTGEGNDLYLNDGRGTFVEQSARSRLGPASLAFTGFGTAWFDFDNDGWLDTMTVNGAVRTIDSLRQAGDPFPLHQSKLLFRNLGGGRFEDVTGRAGAVFGLSDVSRGAAFGDVDSDGDLDVLVANNSGRPRLLVNRIGDRAHWIGLRLVGGAALGRRDMLGARVRVALPDGTTRWRRARADASYASANDPRVLVGLGDMTSVSSVRVQWPDGTSEEWEGVAIDRYTTLEQGRATR
jgi:hypothetical protein